MFISENLEMVQSFERTLQRSYRERLFALAAKLYEMMMVSSRSPSCGTELMLALLYNSWNCESSLFWHQLSSALPELQGPLDPDHPPAASEPAISAVFRRHLSLAVSQPSNKHMPKVQGAEPPPCSRHPLRGLADYAPHLQTEDARV